VGGLVKAELELPRGSEGGEGCGRQHADALIGDGVTRASAFYLWGRSVGKVGNGEGHGGMTESLGLGRGEVDAPTVAGEGRLRQWWGHRPASVTRDMTGVAGMDGW
jgi:hypothetical protein